MSHCKICHRNYSSQRYASRDHRSRLWISSKYNARAKEVIHTITKEDIELPETCAYLGVKLDYSTGERSRANTPYAPSIDRIVPMYGYVPGNIQVISDLANRMKNNATIEELLAFAAGVLRVHSS